MVKKQIEPLSKAEMDSLLLASSDNEYYHTLFLTAKKTSRRLGELWGKPRMCLDREDVYTDRLGNKRVRKFYRKVKGEYDGGVQVKDIDFDTGVMWCWIAKKKKWQQGETIMSSDVIVALKRFIRHEKLKLDDFVFRKRTRRAIQKAVKVYALKAGISKNVCFHNFRHYLVSELVKQGWSHDRISKITLHSNPSTLVNYDHVVATDIKRDALEALKDI